MLNLKKILMDKPFNLHHTYASQKYYATRQIFGCIPEYTIPNYYV
jgi:hypothetical protein